VRVVRTPSGEVAVDASGRMNGRGAYLCADSSCWTAALKKNALGRALGVEIPPELKQRLETALPVSPEGGPSGA
jgi:predicted RNA-binding protein YlxR (DUF448 family)